MSDNKKKQSEDGAARSEVSSIETNQKSDTTTSTSNQSRTKQKFQRQKSRRSMNGPGKRSDLGTVNVNKNVESSKEETSYVGGFVGSISSILFGRKGGLL